MSTQDFIKATMQSDVVRFGQFTPSMEDYVFYDKKANQEYNPNLNGEDATKPSTMELFDTIAALCISQEGFLDTLRKKFNIAKSFDMEFYDNFSKHAEALKERLAKNGAKKGTVKNIDISNKLLDVKSNSVPKDLLKAISNDFNNIDNLIRCGGTTKDCFNIFYKLVTDIGTIETTGEAEGIFKDLVKKLKNPLESVNGIDKLTDQHLGGFIPVFGASKVEYKNKLGSLFYTTTYGMAKIEVPVAEVPALTEHEMEGLITLFKSLEVKISTTFNNAVTVKDKWKKDIESDMHNVHTKLNYLHSFIKHSNDDFLLFQWDCFVDYIYGFMYGRYITMHPSTMQEYFFHVATPVLKYIDLSIDD